MSVLGFDHLVLTVADLRATIGFYERIVGLEARPFTTADGEVRHALYGPDFKINLHQAGAEFAPHAAHPTPGSADLCFRVEGPIADVETRLEAQSAEILEGPVKRSGARTSITSFYLRDPDGNLIELGVEDTTSGA